MIITFAIHWKYKVWKIITFYLKLNTEFFTFHGGYLLNTKLYVSGVGFSVVGLDRQKKPPAFIDFKVFCLLLSWWYWFYLKLHFEKLQSKISQWRKFYSDNSTFKAFEEYRYGLRKLYRNTLTKTAIKHV